MGELFTNNSDDVTIFLRLNFLSCCGIGPLLTDHVTGQQYYGSYNFSAPRFPKNLAQITGSTISMVLNYDHTFGLNSLSNSTHDGLL